MNETEKAYVAGIIDGEGTISITHYRHAGQKINITKTIRVVGTDIRLLEWLKSRTGLGVIRPLLLDVLAHPNNKPQYSWSPTGKGRKAFLIDILPYLVLKRRQAELMLESLELSKHRGNGKYYSEEILKRQVEIKGELNTLNHRGN